MAYNRPTPELLREGIARDLKYRQQAHPELDCEVVYRYGGFVGSGIECYETLPRAMDHARALIDRVEADSGSVVNGQVILADAMSRSKGRFTRTWHAPSGGVWGCLIHGSTLLPQSRAYVPLAVGVACCEAVRELGGDGATLRWVNDVLFGEKKVAGFLVEGYSGRRYGDEYHLVGFGINVNNLQFPQELQGTATSLAAELGREVDVTLFTTLFLVKLAWNFGLVYHEEARMLADDAYSGPGGSHRLMTAWRSLSDSVGQRVVFGFDVMTAPQYEATVVGVDDDGGLRLRLDDGFVKTEYSGEIRYR